MREVLQQIQDAAKNIKLNGISAIKVYEIASWSTSSAEALLRLITTLVALNQWAQRHYVGISLTHTSLHSTRATSMGLLPAQFRLLKTLLDFGDAILGNIWTGTVLLRCSYACVNYGDSITGNGFFHRCTYLVVTVRGVEVEFKDQIERAGYKLSRYV